LAWGCHNEIVPIGNLHLPPPFVIINMQFRCPRCFWKLQCTCNCCNDLVNDWTPIYKPGNHLLTWKAEFLFHCYHLHTVVVICTRRLETQTSIQPSIVCNLLWPRWLESRHPKKMVIVAIIHVLHMVLGHVILTFVHLSKFESSPIQHTIKHHDCN
jgi:hypothetical protein